MTKNTIPLPKSPRPVRSGAQSWVAGHPLRRSEAVPSALTSQTKNSTFPGWPGWPYEPPGDAVAASVRQVRRLGLLGWLISRWCPGRWWLPSVRGGCLKPSGIRLLLWVAPQPSGGCDTTLPPVIGRRIPTSSKRSSQTLSHRIDTRRFNRTTRQSGRPAMRRCGMRRSMPAFRSVVSALVSFVMPPISGKRWGRWVVGW